jgi:hypothetical protein
MNSIEDPMVFCKKCQKSKPDSEFYTNKRSGKRVYPCKDCKRDYYKMWTSKHPEYHKSWKGDNKDKVKEHNKRYRERRKALDEQ